MKRELNVRKKSIELYHLPFLEGRPVKDGNISLANGATTGQFILNHNSDTQVPAYRITTGYKPTYKGSASYPDGTPILMSDFYSSTNTDSDNYKDWTSPFTYDTHYDRRGW